MFVRTVLGWDTEHKQRRSPQYYHKNLRFTSRVLKLHYVYTYSVNFPYMQTGEYHETYKKYHYKDQNNTKETHFNIYIIF